MKKHAVTLWTFAALIFATAPVLAGDRAGAVTVSPYIGGYTFDGTQHVKTAPVYGLRLGYDLTKNWGVEAVGAYLNSEVTHSDRSLNALSYRLDILYNFMPVGPLVPYLAAGGGGIVSGHGADGLKISDRTNDVTANAGFGIKYFLTDSIALRGDARQLFLFESHNSVIYNWEYTAGITFLFGGTSAVEPITSLPVSTQPAPAPTSRLKVVPYTITKGEGATLTWHSQNAADCDIQPHIGRVKAKGSMIITPATDTVYHLKCYGPGGTTSSSANIIVAAPS